MGYLYLLHFDRPISEKHSAQHYVGWSADLMPRIYAHLQGQGARLTEVAKERGIGFTVARIWEDASRSDERKLKNRHNAPKLCPICQGHVLQLPLLPGECATVPSHDEPEIPSWELAKATDFQLNFDDFNVEMMAKELADYIDEQDRAWFAEQGIDAEAELQELNDGLADEDFWRSGAW